MKGDHERLCAMKHHSVMKGDHERLCAMKHRSVMKGDHERLCAMKHRSVMKGDHERLCAMKHRSVMKGDHERLWAMKHRTDMRGILPPAGFEPRIPEFGKEKCHQFVVCRIGSESEKRLRCTNTAEHSKRCAGLTVILKYT